MTVSDETLMDMADELGRVSAHVQHMETALVDIKAGQQVVTGRLDIITDVLRQLAVMQRDYEHMRFRVDSIDQKCSDAITKAAESAAEVAGWRNKFAGVVLAGVIMLGCLTWFFNREISRYDELHALPAVIDKLHNRIADLERAANERQPEEVKAGYYGYKAKN